MDILVMSHSLGIHFKRNMKIRARKMFEKSQNVTKDETSTYANLSRGISKIYRQDEEFEQKNTCSLYYCKIYGYDALFDVSQSKYVKKRISLGE